MIPVCGREIGDDGAFEPVLAFVLAQRRQETRGDRFKDSANDFSIHDSLGREMTVEPADRQSCLTHHSRDAGRLESFPAGDRGGRFENALAGLLFSDGALIHPRRSLPARGANGRGSFSTHCSSAFTAIAFTAISRRGRNLSSGDSSSTSSPTDRSECQG